jgi:hypothetical protein
VRLYAEHAAGVGRQRDGQNWRARHRSPPPFGPQLRPPERRRLPATTTSTEQQRTNRGSRITTSPPLQVKHGEEEKQPNPPAYPPNDPPDQHSTVQCSSAHAKFSIDLLTAVGKAKTPRTWRSGEAGPADQKWRGKAREGGGGTAAAAEDNARGGGYWTGSVGAWMPTGPGPLSVIAAVRYKMDGLHAARGRRRRRLQVRARLGILVVRQD